MKLGYVGLGKMGKNMVFRLLEKGHDVVAWNRSPEPLEEVAAAGATPAESIEQMVQELTAPRVIWLMLPAGDITHQTMFKLSQLLDPGDIIIDGGNSLYTNTIEQAETLASKKIRLIDVGVSGGPEGARTGACVMVGGDLDVFKQLEPLFQDIAAPEAYQHFPGVGAGHFVKMVHNGIEYGMMQAIAEGFAVMKASSFSIDLSQAARIYNQKSVIESRLIEWLHQAYQENTQDLHDISGEIHHSGEGQWTVETAKELGIPVPVIEDALQFRLDSKGNPSYTGQVVSALRNQFGGHDVSKNDSKQES